MYCVSLFIFFFFFFVYVRTYYARLIYSGDGRPREDPVASSRAEISRRDRKQNYTAKCSLCS